MPAAKSEEESLSQWVKKTETCWIWTGFVDKHGYGQVSLKGKTKRAHRAVYEWLVGPVPKGLVLDHVKERGCTSNLCVNPAHMEPVTQAENMRRSRKLSEEVRQAIRDEYIPGKVSQQSLADKYGISQLSVSNIIRRVSGRSRTPNTDWANEQ